MLAETQGNRSSRHHTREHEKRTIRLVVRFNAAELHMLEHEAQVTGFDELAPFVRRQVMQAARVAASHI